MQNINISYFLPLIKPSRWAIGGILLFVLMVAIVMLFPHGKNKPPEETRLQEVTASHTKSVSKTEKNHLSAATRKEANDAADNPYIINTEQAARLRAVLLPKPHDKHLPALLPPPLPMAPPATAPAASPPATQRCNYNGQTYVPGDIVKTNQGWIRCTPTLFFTSDNPARQNGSAAWTVVQ